jgi:transposase-like protein
MERKLENFCCQNEKCPNYGKRNGGNLSYRGWSGKGKRIRMLHCNTCDTVFSERKGTVLEESRLPDEKVESILQHIQEGCGTRSTSRLTGVNKDTVTRYTKIAGWHAEKVHDEKVAFSPSNKRNTNG